MAITVGTSTLHPNYHIKLTDTSGSSLGLVLCDSKGEPTEQGIRQAGIPRSTLRISQGNGGYDDLEPPYTPVTQSDFSGGRGSDDFGKDSTRYLDSFGVDTTSGKVLLGPAAVTSNTFVYSQGSAGGTAGRIDTGPLVDEMAYKFINGTAATIHKLRLWLRNTTGVARRVYAYIYADNAGTPTGTSPLFSLAPVTIPGNMASHMPFDFSYTTSSFNLSAGTAYWIAFGSLGATAEVYTTSTYPIYKSYLGTWSAFGGNATIRMEIYGAYDEGEFRYFEYKNALYCVTRPVRTGAPRLYINGYRGLAADNSADLSLLKTGMSLAENVLAGTYVKVYLGPGSADEWNWRKIMSNTTGGDCTVEPIWYTAHTAATEYVILGTDRWVEITGHGLTYPVTDVAVVEDTVYFAQGEGIAMQRMREYNSSGTWTREFETDANWADFLAVVPDTDGTPKVWRANKGSVTVGSASPVAWGTDLTFSANISCGQMGYTRISGLAVYGNPVKPWVMLEDGFGSISGNVFSRVPLSEITNVKSPYNGRAWLQHDLYLYFSLLDGLERYYDQRLDDMGPNRDKGLPAARQGAIKKLVGYPGRIYAAIDARDMGYSSILCYTGQGWHEIYRAGTAGDRILDMYIQVLPDGKTWLWFSEGGSFKRLRISRNPEQESDYTYNSAGILYTGWVDVNLFSIDKFLSQLTLFTDHLSTNPEVRIEVYYQLDSGTDYGWTDYVSDGVNGWVLINPSQTVSSEYTTSPIEEKPFSALYTVKAKRFRLAIKLATTSNTVSPKLNAWLADTVTRIPVKNSWTVTFLAADNQVDLNGQNVSLTANDVLAKLQTWANSKTTATPLYMESNHTWLNGKWVFVDPASIQPLQAIRVGSGREVRLIGQMSLTEA